MTITHRARRRFGVLALTLSICATAGIAVADQLVNQLDATVDSDFETMALKVGDPAKSTGLYVLATTGGGDAENGCNFKGSAASATFSVSSSNTAAATVSLVVPSGAATGANATTVSDNSFTIRRCSSGSGETDPLVLVRVTPVGSGSSNITLAPGTNNTDGSFDVTTARFQVNVDPVVAPNTAPTVNVTGVAAGASYQKGSVPAAGCTVSDTEDALSNSTTAATPQVGAIAGPDAGNGIGTQTVTCSYTDGGGTTVTRSATYAITDGTAPVISKVVSPSSPDGSNGWYRTKPVTLDWTVTEGDSTSTLQTVGCVDQNLASDQAETTYGCSATSSGGNASDSVSIKIDGTAPTVSGQLLGTPISGWYSGDVTVDWTCSDAIPGSGLAAGCPADGTIVGEGTGLTTQSGDVYDNAGNKTDAASPPAKIDRTAPVVTGTLTGTKFTVGSADWYKDSALVTWSATDIGGSGVASGPAPASQTFSDGAGQSASASATDVVGHTGNGLVSGVNVDARAPTVSAAISSTPAYNDGSADWYKDHVDIAVTASDPTPGSGLSPTSATTGTVTRSASGSYTAQAIDNVGHTTDAATLTFQVDSAGPAITCPTTTYVLGQTATASASDTGGSGVAATGNTLSQILSAVGDQQITFTAVDNVGHVTDTQCTVGVRYGWNGFLQPINDTAHQIGTAQSRFRLGSTVPVKLRLADSDGGIVTAATLPGFGRKYMGASCNNTGDVETQELAPTTVGTTFRYDAFAQQYIYNFSTKGLTPGEWRVLAYLDDGSVAKSVDLCLTK